MTVSTDSPAIGVRVTGNQPAEQVSPERFDVVVIGGGQAGCYSTSSAPDNVHRGRWWTLRGRRCPGRPPPQTTELRAEEAKTRSPLTDSNRRPPPYHFRAQAICR
jgi:hypothetical protein